MTGTDADASDVLDESLQPDWPNQVAYNIVPCKGTSDYCWVRKSDCTTIGMLLRALGPYKSAKKIYAFFSTLRKVSTKSTFGNAEDNRRPCEQYANHARRGQQQVKRKRHCH